MHAALVPDKQSELSLGMPVLAELVKDLFVNIGAEGLEQRDQIRGIVDDPSSLSRHKEPHMFSVYCLKSA
jgi:hypothetical protein